MTTIYQVAARSYSRAMLPWIRTGVTLSVDNQPRRKSRSCMKICSLMWMDSCTVRRVPATMGYLACGWAFSQRTCPHRRLMGRQQIKLFERTACCVSACWITNGDNVLKKAPLSNFVSR